MSKEVDTQLRSTGPRHRVLTHSSSTTADDAETGTHLSDVDLKGATAEQLSALLEKTSREFKERQSKLQPVLIDLRQLRQVYTEIEAEYTDKKLIFEKQTVGLDMEKQAVEKQCDIVQEECLREESRFHYLQNLLSVNKIRLERAEQEQHWRDGDGRLMREFTSFKTLYENKLSQQEQLVKTLRKRQRDLKDLSESVGDQKKYFLNVERALSAKMTEDRIT